MFDRTKVGNVRHRNVDVLQTFVPILQNTLSSFPVHAYD